MEQQMKRFLGFLFLLMLSMIALIGFMPASSVAAVQAIEGEGVTPEPENESTGENTTSEEPTPEAEETPIPIETPGSVDPSPLVSGGKEANSEQFPWQVALHRQYLVDPKPFCSGVIIDPKWVLTAAHCNLSNPDTLIAQAGSVYADKGQSLRVAQVHLHPNYGKDGDDVHDDIALLELKEPIILDKFVQVIPIAEQRHKYLTNFYKTVTISGWGSNTTLSFANFGVITSLSCEAFGIDPNGQEFCVHSYADNYVCKGDGRSTRKRENKKI
ncbi:MAG: serine protease [Ardenticatenaceae bacterium]|nr:serine protease [Ardenticatenaceae bacterium]